MPRLALFTGLVFIALAPQARAQQRPDPAQFMPWQAVDRIAAGNVIEVRERGLVRLAGIDDGGPMAQAFLAGILSGQPVRMIPTAYSSGGMTEAFVYTPDGRCVNVEMLRQGYARVRVTPGFDREAEFRGLQADAERLKRGLWDTSHDISAPAAATSAPAAIARGGAGGARRVLVAAGGGATDRRPRAWAAQAEIGFAASRALGLYLSAAYVDDAGDRAAADAGRVSLGSAGVRLTSPARLPLRPYLRAGGGYLRVDPGAAGRRDRPFWEAGAGLLIEAGALHLDAGYVHAAADAFEAGRGFVLAGIRF